MTEISLLFDEKVPIKNTLRHKLPFPKILSKHATAIILTFFGKKNEVYRFLQILNHTGRAFCVYQKGLKGFLVSDPVYYKHLSAEAIAFDRQIELDRYFGKMKIGKLQVKCI